MHLTTERDSNIHLVKATKFIRRMRGGSQACLLECSDHAYYVTKMFGNPQGANVLANEWIGTAMARAVGLRVPDSAMVEISDSFLDENPHAFFEELKERRRPRSGLHFGSALVQSSTNGVRVLDRLTGSQEVDVRHNRALIGVTLLDLLAELQDTRQMVFSRPSNNNIYQPTFIDFGDYCRGTNWNRSSPKSGPFKYSVSAFPALWKNRSIVNKWLTSFERKLPDALAAAVSTLPSAWYQGDLPSTHSHYQRRIKEFSDIAAPFLDRQIAYGMVSSIVYERRTLR